MRITHQGEVRLAVMMPSISALAQAAARYRLAAGLGDDFLLGGAARMAHAGQARAQDGNRSTR